MARGSKKHKNQEISHQQYEKDGVIMIESPSFLYDIQTFVIKKRSYNLIDSRFIMYKEPVSKNVVYNKTKNRTLVQYYNLIGAPKRWLWDNRFTPLSKQPDERT